MTHLTRRVGLSTDTVEHLSNLSGSKLPSDINAACQTSDISNISFDSTVSFYMMPRNTVRILCTDTELPKVTCGRENANPATNLISDHGGSGTSIRGGNNLCIYRSSVTCYTSNCVINL